MKKLTKTDVAAIKNLYNKGVSIKTIADSFNMNYSSIRYHVNSIERDSKRGAYIRKLTRSVPDCEIPYVVSNYLNKTYNINNFRKVFF